MKNDFIPIKISYLQGDSGGPMLERLLTYDSINNRMIEQYRVVGIVSAGIGKLKFDASNFDFEIIFFFFG